MKRVEVAEASWVEEFAKIQDENEELKRYMRDSQAGLLTLANDRIVVTTKVSVLEARARRSAEECSAQEEFVKDMAIQEAVEQAVDNFKQSEEYATLMTTSYDAGYDTGVEEILFDIWRKHWDIDYRFL